MSKLPRSGTCGIAVMAKASRAGFSKTRLIPALGQENAARLNTAFISDVCANLLAAAQMAPIHGYVAFGPSETRSFFEFLPETIELIEACRSDFGDTLMAAMRGVLERGHMAACLINADSPTLPPAFLVEATSHLFSPRCDLVLGPSDDGGYYLVGARAVHPGLFENMTWSTATVFEETKRRAEALGLAVHILPSWYDVDDAVGLEVLRAELFESRGFGPSTLRAGEARASRLLLREIACCASKP